MTTTKDKEETLSPKEEAKESGENKSDTLNNDIPHKLQFSWTTFYSPPKTDTSKRWMKRHGKLADITTVQDFWRVFNSLVPPSQMPDGADIPFFRMGHMPEWEDQFNHQGGTFMLFLHNSIQNSESNELADKVWLNCLLNIIGDQFDDADEICGLIVSKRQKGIRFNLWIKTASDVDARKRLAMQFLRFANLGDPKHQIKFWSHEHAKTGDVAKQKLYKLPGK